MTIDTTIRPRRGTITEFSDSSHRRLTRKLAELVSATTDGLLVAVTLTTNLTDAKKAKLRLKLWADNMRHAHAFAGVYVVEFNRAGGVHFHMTLRYFGDIGVEALRRDCFRRWRRHNPSSCPDSASFTAITDAEGWNHYIAKRNEQKCLRGAIGADGLGGTWWGVFGKKFFRGNGGAAVFPAVPNPVNEPNHGCEKAADFQPPAEMPDAA